MPMSKVKENKIRLNLFISKYAGCSRREADALIQSKKIKVNGHLVLEAPFFVDPKKDKVQVNKKILKPFSHPIYIAFNKPDKTITASKETTRRPTVYHYLRKVRQRVFHVGRLDWNTEGLLLFTNDGALAQKILKPRYKIEKTYLAKLDGTPSPGRLEKLKRGVSIPGGGRVKAVSIQKKQKSWVRIVITEGKNKQIHFMFNKIGFSVKRLKRIAIGGLKLGSLKKGEWRLLTKKDLTKIFNH